jgi:protease II
MKNQPPQEQPIIVALRAADDLASEKIVFDPNAASAKGSVSVDYYVPSLDGKYVAAALSENGSEESTAHVFEVATGKELSDRVPGVNSAGAAGSIGMESRHLRFLSHSPSQRSRLLPANLLSQTRIPSRTPTLSAKSFPASQKSNEVYVRVTMGGGWLSPYRTETAAR